MKSVNIRRILITVGALICYQLGRYIPIFGLKNYRFFPMISGISSSKFSIFALGLMPYVNAYIIVMILALIMPYFVKIVKKEGLNSTRLNKLVIYGTLLFAIVQSFVLSLWMARLLYQRNLLVPYLSKNIFILATSLTLTIGVFFTIWLGKIITKHGTGHGISLLIIVPIVDKMCRGVVNAWFYSKLHGRTIVLLLFLGIVMVLVWVTKYFLEYTRKINIKVNRKNGGSASLDIPLSLPGILPLYFAVYVIHFPILLSFGRHNTSLLTGKTLNFLPVGNIVGSWVIFGVLVAFFTYFVMVVVVDIIRWSDNMKMYGLIIPNVEAGKSTVEHLDALLRKLSIKWIAFLLGISLLWELLPYGLKLPYFQSSSRDFILIVGISLVLWRTLTNKRYRKEVYSNNDIGKIFIAKALLESKGINVFIEDVEAFGRIMPITIGNLGLKKVLVEEKSFIQAKEIISTIS